MSPAQPFADILQIERDQALLLKTTVTRVYCRLFPTAGRNAHHRLAAGKVATHRGAQDSPTAATAPAQAGHPPTSSAQCTVAAAAAIARGHHLLCSRCPSWLLAPAAWGLLAAALVPQLSAAAIPRAQSFLRTAAAAGGPRLRLEG